MFEPLVSIIIPHYNREFLIKETLISLIEQTYHKWEAIIVDDGSKTESLNLLQQLADADKRFTLFERNRSPKGCATCRNIGFMHAKGDYIIFLDSDDLLAPYCLAQRLEAAARYPDKAYYVFKLLGFRNTPGDSNILLSIFDEADDLDRFMHQDIPWGTPSIMWKKQAIEMFDGWEEKILIFTDWDFHIRALLKKLQYCKLDLLPDVFVRRNKAISRISTQTVSEESLLSKIYFFNNLAQIVKDKQQLKISHKRKIAYSLLICAEQIIMSRVSIHYFSALKPIKTHSLISNNYLNLIKCYLWVFKLIDRLELRIIRSLVYKIIRVFLPADMVKTYSSHEKNTISKAELAKIFSK